MLNTPDKTPAKDQPAAKDQSSAKDATRQGPVAGQAPAQQASAKPAADRTMAMPTIILVGADKGGVGKTTVTRTLLDYLAAQDIPLRAFDTEAPKGTLKRFHPDVTDVVDVTSAADQMKIFDTINAAEVTVIDVRAGLAVDHAAGAGGHRLPLRRPPGRLQFRRLPHSRTVDLLAGGDQRHRRSI